MNYRLFNQPDEAIEIIGGDTADIPFTVTDEFGNPIDIWGASITWKLAPFVSLSTAVTKSTSTQGQIVLTQNKGEFAVHLVPSDTSSLSGVYLYQGDVTPAGSTAYRRVQGLFYIWPKLS